MKPLVITAVALLASVSAHPQAGWKNGPSTDPSFFPIAVWLQSPENAPRFQAAGINTYVGLWEGPTEVQLSALKAAGVRVFCEQNRVGLAHKDDPTIEGWMHGDEPDNAQEVTDPKTGQKGYGPCVPPEKIVDEYEKMRAADPTRPVMLNLGQGVANDEWIGRGNGSKLDDYLTYVKGADIVSFDIYPVTGLEKPDSENYLWYVPKGVDRLQNWTQGKKRIWNCIECTAIGGGKKATPHQVKAEVWMSLIHGSRGLIYFVHQFKPKFDEWALRDDPTMLAGVTGINKQIQALAPVLNSPSINRVATVKSDTESAPVDLMVKRQGGFTYLFAVGMRNVASTATFAFTHAPQSANLEVIGENRSVPILDGKFADAFAPYDVHLYRMKG